MAAFDTVYHDILLQHLQQFFNVDGHSTFIAMLSGHSSPILLGDLFRGRCCSFCKTSTSLNCLKEMAWHGTISVCQRHSSQQLMPSFQRQHVFGVDVRLLERRCQLDEIEQASVKLIKD